MALPSLIITGTLLSACNAADSVPSVHDTASDISGCSLNSGHDGVLRSLHVVMLPKAMC